MSEVIRGSHYVNPVFMNDRLIELYNRIIVIEENGYIENLYFASEKESGKIDREKTNLLKRTYEELWEYFLGLRNSFDLPLNPKGTEFQHKVWSELKKIPFGETRSYKEIAIAVGNEKAARAVGMANNKNPIAIIIPCHRVIGANNKLVGYAGGLDIKKLLLNLENSTKG